jgi:hypothetical protein
MDKGRFEAFCTDAMLLIHEVVEYAASPPADHRTRRALLHLSYSCAPQITHAALVTHDPEHDLFFPWVVARSRCERLRPGRPIYSRSSPSPFGSDDD